MHEVIILGAHTATARSLYARLADRGVDAVQATTSDHIEDDLVLIDASLLQREGPFVLATDEAVAVKLAGALAARGARVLDVAEALDEGPWIWPTLTASASDEAVGRIAVGPAAPLAAVLSALSGFGPTRATVTTLESVVARGRPGIDELSEHTRAIFAMRDVDPEVFVASVAFDPIPSLATGDEHPFAADERLVHQTQDALQAVGRSAPDLAVTRVVVPTFVADSAVVHLTTEDPAPDEAMVVDALEAGRSLRRVPRAIVPALDAVDRDDVLVSRVRVGPHRIDLWMAYDRTRAGSAVPAALAVEAWIAK